LKDVKTIIDVEAVKGLGALLAIPAIKQHSFGGFCACIFIIGNGLGSLETAANPYIASKT
jgi:FHS family L-fucose permease-like MFS transporter